MPLIFILFNNNNNKTFYIQLSGQTLSGMVIRQPPEITAVCTKKKMQFSGPKSRPDNVGDCKDLSPPIVIIL